VAGLHKANGLVASVVGYLWARMEDLSNTVTGVASHDREPFWLNYIRDNVPDFPIHGVWLAVLNRFHQGLVSCFNKYFG